MADKRIAIYPGTFDPFTVGHLDIAERASLLFDELVIGVLINENKTPLFTIEERVEQIQTAVFHLDNVRVVSFNGLLVDLLQQEGARFVVRGLRDAEDVAYEQALSKAYRAMYANMDIIYLLALESLANVSSTMVREGLKAGTDVLAWVPEQNRKLLATQWGKKHE